ncbi:Cx9C motif-containing protein 4, mitochondrial [Podospora pseudopauciseta]|uniref:Cx9C motif-containing protein 4, mitochondrial n=2 Tax=Podospora TaxID=5144 RepID=A0ABR0I076_9PEZI|nr:Cx9C motif-containing protein 4, mitochondrial [Podospora pseudopauciseta]KAK4682007.1 Cx9C motif-containing protein 4, mitochondrial [Podospora pseudoanserina]
MALVRDLQTDPPCHPRALTGITDCLTRNGFDEAKCTRYVDALYECCQAFYKKNGDEATTVSCPKASLLRLKMEQREKAKQ